jgi:hypothetical protein
MLFTTGRYPPLGISARKGKIESLFPPRNVCYCSTYSVGDLYQPETRPEPTLINKVGVRTNTRQQQSFCPLPSMHLGKPANGSPGREPQRSRSCNPRILLGRGMFDGTSFLLGEGFSRGGSLFLIIFKLWYKRTPLTGKPRHERPPLPPQICLG